MCFGSAGVHTCWGPDSPVACPSAQVAAGVSARKHKEIVARAAALGIKVTNYARRVRAEESE